MPNVMPSAADGDRQHPAGDVDPDVILRQRFARQSTGKHDEPACPRCGYDLSGARATWTESCPLEGTCPECGLAYVWAEIILPDKFAPRWCVEFVQPRQRVPRASVMTFKRSLVPTRFWTALRMSQPLRPRRLMAHVLLLLAPLLIMYALSQSLMAVSARAVVAQHLARDHADAQQELARLQALVESADYQRYVQYGGNRRMTIGQQIATLQVDVTTPPAISFTYLEAVFEALTRPLGHRSTGTVVTRSRVTGYPAPREVWAIVAAELGLRSRFSIEQAMAGLALLGAVTLVLAALPLAFVLLPVSRRRAKVRWAHIVRVATYSLHVPAGALYVLALLQLTSLVTPVSDGLVLWATGPAPLVLLVIWWATAIGRYLRIPHGIAVALLLTVVVALAILVFIGVVVPAIAG